MSDKSNESKGAKIVGGRPRQVVTTGVKIQSASNTKNPDMSKGVEVVARERR